MSGARTTRPSRAVTILLSSLRPETSSSVIRAGPGSGSAYTSSSAPRVGFERDRSERPLSGAARGGSRR